jgi:sulfur-oxidizing protein SoxB
MNLTKREFMQVIGAGSMAGLNMNAFAQADAGVASKGLYDIAKFGQVSFLHMTDCHAQLKPIYFREPSVNLGIGSMRGQLPHLVGEHLLKTVGVRPGTAEALSLIHI